MARDYGRISTGFWNHPKIRGVSDQAKLLANYLMTGPHSNACGAYLLPDAYVADDLGWSSGTVSKLFGELFRIGFCKRFSDGRHIVVCDFLDWNPVENPNVGKGILKQIALLPDDPCLSYVYDGLQKYKEQFPNGFGTLSQRFRNMEPNRTEVEMDPEMEMDGSAAPPALAPAICLPTNLFKSRGEEVAFSQDQLDAYGTTFPAVDVPQQFREMRQWLIDNPERRKTAKGMGKFVNGWLGKEQDKGNGQAGRKSTPHQNFAIGAFLAAGGDLDAA